MPTPIPGSRAPGAFALLRWMMDPEGVFEEGFRLYGDLYAMNNPLYGREVVVGHPELVKQIFTGDPDVYYAGAANFALTPVIGDLSVLVLDGRPHHRMRKLLLPAFMGDRLAGYEAVMREATTRVTADWPVGTPMSVLASMQRVTFDVILETIFGVHEGPMFDELRTRLMGLVDRAQSPLGMLWLLPALQKDLGPLTGWAALKRAISDADASLYAIIAEARAAHARDGAEGRRDVLRALLEVRDDDGAPMSDQELRDQLMTLLLAGHETTALSLAWAVEEIGRRPEVLAAILAEADAEHGGPQPYLDATIKEVLRLHPVTPLLARQIKAPIMLRDHEIPAGTFLVPNVYMLHRHPDYWDEPRAFRPERFLDKKPDPYAWLPFGGGARRCIGMAFALLEMRAVLSTLFSTLRLEPHGKPAALALRSFLFAPKGGTRVIVKERLQARPTERVATAAPPAPAA
jgi:cytochrome P450